MAAYTETISRRVYFKKMVKLQVRMSIYNRNTLARYVSADPNEKMRYLFLIVAQLCKQKEEGK